VKTLLIEQNDYTGGKAVTPTNKDGFSYELGPKLQVPAQGPSFAVAFKELGMESELKPIPLNTAGLAYRGRSGKYKKGTLPASTGLSPEPFFELWDLEPSKHDVALNFMINMAMMPRSMAALDDLNRSSGWQLGPPGSSELQNARHRALAEPIDLVLGIRASGHNAGHHLARGGRIPR
jgi:hypothetical protein